MNNHDIYKLNFIIVWDGDLLNHDSREVYVVAKSLDEALGKGTRLSKDFIDKDSEIQHKILYDEDPPKVFVEGGERVSLFFDEDKRNYELDIRDKKD